MAAETATAASARASDAVGLPRILHFVWLGDPEREPRAAIDSWRVHHPDFEIKVHRDAEADAGGWRFQAEIDEFRGRRRYPGAADLMRWEVLFAEGGVALDADSVCLGPLPDWLLACACAACWDNTFPEGHMLSNGFVLARPRHPIIGAVLDDIGAKPVKFDKWSWSRLGPKPFGEWQTTGPGPFTRVVKRMRPTDFSALPSHFFLPRRRDGGQYDGGGPVFADQLWASTHGQGAETDALTRARLQEWRDAGETDR